MIRLAIGAVAFIVSLPAPTRADTDANVIAPLAYRAIGPAISSGRTTAVAGSDRDPALYYAGGAGGGVFKSTDGGVSWQPVFDREIVAPIGAIALSQHDPNDVWFGTASRIRATPSKKAPGSGTRPTAGRRGSTPVSTTPERSPASRSVRATRAPWSSAFSVTSSATGRPAASPTPVQGAEGAALRVQSKALAAQYGAILAAQRP